MNGLRDMRTGYLQAQDEESRAMAMVAGAVFVTVALLFAALVGITAAMWWTGDEKPLAITTPEGAECMR